jgi:hypothetical protein
MRVSSKIRNLVNVERPYRKIEPDKKYELLVSDEDPIKIFRIFTKEQYSPCTIDLNYQSGGKIHIYSSLLHLQPDASNCESSKEYTRTKQY